MQDHTNDPAATSWVASANLDGTDFPIQNLPFGIFRRKGSGEAFRGGVAIGDCILDLAGISEIGDAAATALAAARKENLNALMALGKVHWQALRHAVFAALATGSSGQAKLEGALVAQNDAEYDLPAAIGDFTDFYASIHHASMVGGMLRPDNPLMPNYKWLPVAYHGRSSSIRVSGHSFPRPTGQLRPIDGGVPRFGPTLRLDFELELGFFIGPGNELGTPIRVAEAEDHVFGACVLNDWSARDIQAWEYQPLGPFLAKNFATTLSPWVVTLQALAPFRTAFERPGNDPAPLPHLNQGARAATAAIDVHLEVALQSAAMRQASVPPARLSRSNFLHAYWTVAQMVAHHTSNGCNLRPGDLLGTGTLSGPGQGELGSLLELTRGGKNPLPLPDGGQRTFIEDGDTLEMRAWCEKPGARRIGFGTCLGTVLPAYT
jgi:fumarylacetoacetase